MDYNFRLGKISTTFIYVLEGVVALVIAIISNRFTVNEIVIAFVHWMVGFILIIVFDRESKIFTFLDTLCQLSFTSAMAITLSLGFKSPVVFVMLLLLQCMTTIIYSRKIICNILLLVQITASTVMTFIYDSLTVYEYISIIIVLLCCNLFSNMLIEILKRQRDVNAEHQQSLDDLLDLVEDKYDEAKLANTAKSSFLANMSHEIRTPINSVLGFDTMILRESDDEKIREYATNIQSAGQSLLSIINDILDFSKIESGKMKIVPVEYELSSLINDVNNMIKEKANEKDLAYEISVDEMVPNKLYGDDVRIKQILINLLTNAVKYTRKGKVTLSVSGEVQKGYLNMFCSIKDTGIGIKEENINDLFSEFVRIEEKRNRNIEGTGLGLNIVSQLLQLMDSRLEVKSVYGEGSEFYFTIRQKIISDEPIGNLQERIKEKIEEYSYEASFTIEDKKLLVVDDNLMNRVIISELLKGLKCSIEEAESGKECLEKVKNTKYDLIFMDHMMPEMDGIETLENMKSMKDSPCVDTPVVILTANAVAGAKEEYLNKGFNDYLSKPINPDELEQMIRKILVG